MYAMKIVARSVKHTNTHTQTHYDGKLLTNVAIEGHPSIISNVIGSNSIYITWWRRRWRQQSHMDFSNKEISCCRKDFLFHIWNVAWNWVQWQFITFYSSFRWDCCCCCCSCCLSIVIGHPTICSVRSFALIFAMLAVCDERWQGNNHSNDDENLSIQF